jgi:predicted site-specific integrase-resolvase
MRKIIVQTPEEKKGRKPASLWKQELPTDYPCQVYPRVSTPEQKNNVSAEMQQDRNFAILCGWPDDNEMIIVETDDLGLSGQLRMEDRPTFTKMIRNIASGKVRAVIVANVDRFFRRKWNKEQTTHNVTQAQIRRTYKQMMRDAGQYWHEVVSPEEMPMLVDTFIDKVVIDPATSHFYKVLIHWCDPEWGIDELVCYRDSNASVLWTENELALLKEHYETASREELLHMFPTRAYTSLVFQATKLGMSRPRHDPTENIPRTFSLLDWQIMQQYSVTEEQLRAKKGGRLIQWGK